jgi:hypothetical protein
MVVLALGLTGAARPASHSALTPSPRAARSPRAPAAAGVAVATLAWMDAGVEREDALGKSGWHPIKPGDSVRTGDRLRTAPDGVARFDLPWMSVTAGPATVMHIPAEVVLSLVLGEGRVEFEGRGRDIVKVRTADAVIRGTGRIVVRRESGRTLVMAMAMDGTFRVEASGEAVVLQAGEGTVVRDGEAPRPAQKLPEAPERLRPGADPLYVANGESATLTWSPAAASSHVQVMALGSDEVLMARDVSRLPYTLLIPWEGTFRWRVSSRDAQGLESRPSEDGLICVVEK